MASSRQCAAVSTQSEVIKDPSQKGRLSGLVMLIVTSHGHALRASSPPTIVFSGLYVHWDRGRDPSLITLPWLPPFSDNNQKKKKERSKEKENKEAENKEAGAFTAICEFH